MASARKKSNSRNRPARRKHSFVVCVRNEGYEASLDLRKLYPSIADRFGEDHGLIRVVDESGEDYLYPADYFVRIELPAGVTEKLRKIA